jgi:hypothetical protein
VRYLIAGGLAVVAHAYLRFTADVDLILDLEPDNVTRAIKALEAIGYQPRVPVAFQDFADAAARDRWAREKLRLKEQAGRAMDVDDIRRLKAIHEDAGE